jgi:hypothetical protein
MFRCRCVKGPPFTPEIRENATFLISPLSHTDFCDQQLFMRSVIMAFLLSWGTNIGADWSLEVEEKSNIIEPTMI